MSNNLFISYDLYSPGQDYTVVIEAIKSLGSWAKVHKSLWYVSSNLSAEQAANAVWEKLDANDSLIVVNSSTNDAYWYNLAPQVGQHIKDHWCS